MVEYISRKDAIARFTFEQGNYIPEKLVDGYDNVIAIRTIKRVLREIPPADVAPAKHGRWIPADQTGDCCYTCSECGFERDAYLLDVGNYCPNCGARMDKEDNT